MPAFGNVILRQEGVGSLLDGDGAFTAFFYIYIGFSGLLVGVAPDSLGGNILLIQKLQNKSGICIASDLADENHFLPQPGGSYSLIGSLAAQSSSGLKDLSCPARLREGVYTEGRIYVNCTHGQDLFAAQRRGDTDTAFAVQHIVCTVRK